MTITLVIAIVVRKPLVTREALLLRQPAKDEPNDIVHEASLCMSLWLARGPSLKGEQVAYLGVAVGKCEVGSLTFYFHFRRMTSDGLEPC